jgi:hypothetical protein
MVTILDQASDNNAEIMDAESILFYTLLVLPENQKMVHTTAGYMVLLRLYF